jgi:hypothetical protein
VTDAIVKVPAPAPAMHGFAEELITTSERLTAPEELIVIAAVAPVVNIHASIVAVELLENVTVASKLVLSISALAPVTKLTGHPISSTPDSNTGPLRVIVLPVPLPKPVVTI